MGGRFRATCERTALCSIRQGRKEEAAAVLQSVLYNVPEGSWYRDVARFLLDPDGETVLLSRIDRERTATLKARMLFYVAATYLGGRMDRAARTYLVQIAGRGAPTAVETQLAERELRRAGLASAGENQ